MGNIHGHRKHRNSGNGSLQNKPASSPFKYGPSDEAAHSSSSTKTNTMNVVSLPYAHVDSSLRALAGQAEGFGHCAIGGLHGPLYHVTTLAGHLHAFISSLYLFVYVFMYLGNSKFWHWDFNY